VIELSETTAMTAMTTDDCDGHTIGCRNQGRLEECNGSLHRKG